MLCSPVTIWPWCEKRVMPAGADVLRELRLELESARDQAGSIRGEWRQFDDRLQQLITDRGAAVLELARHYLPEMSQERIEGTFAGVRDELRQILDRKQRQQESFSGQQTRLVTEVTNEEQELAQVTAELSQKVAEREELSRKVSDFLAQDATFQEASKRAIAAETELNKNEQRAEEISRDAEEKLPAYQRSSLFQYLHRCGYGTDQYTGHGLRRRLDRWLANLIGYARAFSGYEFLTSAPELVRKEVERRKVEFHPLMAAVEDLEQTAADQFGLTQVLLAGEQLGTRRDELVTRVGEQRTLLQEVEQKLLALQHNQGPFYEEALGRFRQFLEATRTEVLEQQARLTPELTDDDLVSRIRTLTTEIEQLRPQLDRHHALSVTAEQQVAGLEFVLRRFQQANYDSPRSDFESDFNVREQLARFRKQVLDKDALWDHLRRAQRFEPTWMEESATGMATNATQILAHPMTQVLMHAMVEAAGVALQNAAQRSVARRHLPANQRRAERIDRPAPTWHRTNTPAPPTRSQTKPPTRGFTTGDGF
ncbi:MAG: hypothetical protein KDA58_02295 [Planctomycetaceae bacterium]|nr:hypothetical protein [Planctomycetaceae bacterium]